jgi:anti-sigma B factor antagonist
MSCHVQSRDGMVLVVITGEIDISVEHELAAGLDRAIHEARRVVGIDLGGVYYIDSTGCSCLAQASLAAHERAVDLHVTSASSIVQRVFEVAGLEELLA